MSGLARHALVLSLGFLLLACEPGKRPESLLDVAPYQVGLAVHVGSIHNAIHEADTFLARLTRKAGHRALARTRARVRESLGFDPLDPDGLKILGIDTSDGLLLFAPAQTGALVVACKVSSRRRFDTALKRLVAAVDGANMHSSSKIHGRNIQTASRPFGTQQVPALHWSHLGNYAVIASGDQREIVTQVLERFSERSTDGTGMAQAAGLAANMGYRTLLGKVPKGLAHVYVGPAVRTAASEITPSLGSVASVRWNAGGVQAEGFSHNSGATTAPAKDLVSLHQLARRVDEDAVAVLFSNMVQAQGLAQLRQQWGIGQLLEVALHRAAKETGLDIEKDILTHLKGSVTLAVHPGDLAALPQAIKHRGAAGAMVGVEVGVTADLADSAGMRGLLERTHNSLAQRGRKIEAFTMVLDGAPIKVFRPAPIASQKALVPLGWSVWGDHYVYGSGRARLETTVSRLVGLGAAKRKGAAPSSIANTKVVRTWLQQQTKGASSGAPRGTFLLIRGGALAEAIRRGLGSKQQAGLGILPILTRVTAGLETVGDIWLAVTPTAEGLRFVLQETMG